MMTSSIASINHLPESERRSIYARLIPGQLIDYFGINPFLVDRNGNDLLQVACSKDGSSVEVSLYHEPGFPDPVLYGHMTDTINGQIHILLYIINDPASPRFDVDRMPDGTPTQFGTRTRNLEAEQAAMSAGLLPGQIRKGLHLLREAQDTFEFFIKSLGHTIYFVEPLYYHNAIIFEKYGFAYQKGRRLMEEINRGFSEGGAFISLLGTTPFRDLSAPSHISLRSWAIHDGILGRPFGDITMYKTIGNPAGIRTTGEISW